MSYVPNLLSFARLAAAPYIFFALWRRQWDAALLVILFAAMTDALDGYLARHWRASSRTGEVLDPIADKVLLSGAFLTLAFAGSIETWLAVIVLGRDALILLFAGGVLVFSKSAHRFPPSLWGKISTTIQILFVLAVVGNGAGLVPSILRESLKWTTAVVTLWSGIDYAKRSAYNLGDAPDLSAGPR
ncbi:MAG TPA: CDP-alcohol phosphatidyltransferase family protein [Bryobacteraceae bacterium]|nr:CDP-alcohol phosphatidyltransferase family protein [Bryobacteraceae bacterium]